jgi:nucleotide-binding universal stress UspA family protein
MTNDLQRDFMQSVGPPCGSGFKNIFLATDFSAASQVAFRASLRLCQIFHAALHILNVVECAGLPFAEYGERSVNEDRLYQNAELSLDDLLLGARRAGIRCEGTVELGIPHQVILKNLGDQDIDLVVLGTKSIRGFERLVFGSTAEGILRKALCPVFTLGSQANEWGLEMHHPAGPIIFATDFHLSTVEAMRYATTFSKVMDLPLHRLHVLPRALEDGTGKGAVPLIITEALQHLSATDGDGSKPSVCAVTYGSEISNAVVGYARKQDAKLIVLGVRRSSLMAAHVTAHIAYRIIAEAPCPVLTIAFPLPVEMCTKNTMPTIQMDSTSAVSILQGFTRATEGSVSRRL